VVFRDLQGSLNLWTLLEQNFYRPDANLLLNQLSRTTDGHFYVYLDVILPLVFVIQTRAIAFLTGMFQLVILLWTQNVQCLYALHSLARNELFTTSILKQITWVYKPIQHPCN